MHRIPDRLVWYQAISPRLPFRGVLLPSAPVIRQGVLVRVHPRFSTFESLIWVFRRRIPPLAFEGVLADDV